MEPQIRRMNADGGKLVHGCGELRDFRLMEVWCRSWQRLAGTLAPPIEAGKGEPGACVGRSRHQSRQNHGGAELEIEPQMAQMGADGKTLDFGPSS